MLEPLLDRIIVEPVKKEDRTESGIILPDTARIEVQYEGRTLMVIPEKEILARVKNG